MGLRAAPIALLLALSVSTVGDVRADDSERPDAPPLKPCVAVGTSAPYVNYGYDHVVTLRATCAKPQRCTVKTDAAPSPQVVDLAANETKSLVTFRGSPSREFKADVSCQPVG